MLRLNRVYLLAVTVKKAEVSNRFNKYIRFVLIRFTYFLQSSRRPRLVIDLTSIYVSS
jgi:hypothetical protein